VCGNGVRKAGWGLERPMKSAVSFPANDRIHSVAGIPKHCKQDVRTIVLATREGIPLSSGRPHSTGIWCNGVERMDRLELATI